MLLQRVAKTVTPAPAPGAGFGVYAFYIHGFPTLNRRPENLVNLDVGSTGMTERAFDEPSKQPAGWDPASSEAEGREGLLINPGFAGECDGSDRP